jgi:hypothetical protein
LIFGDEALVSDDSTDARFSAMSLAVAKDSGWYDVDMSLAENYFWGKNEGCSIFDNSCSTSSVTEFCSVEGHNGCSDNHMYKTTCESSALTGNCNIYLNSKSCKVLHKSDIKAFEYGIDSMCLNGKVNKNFFKIILSLQIKIKISENASKSHVQVINNLTQFILIKILKSLLTLHVTVRVINYLLRIMISNFTVKNQMSFVIKSHLAMMIAILSKLDI